MSRRATFSGSCPPELTIPSVVCKIRMQSSLLPLQAAHFFTRPYLARSENMARDRDLNSLYLQYQPVRENLRLALMTLKQPSA